MVTVHDISQIPIWRWIYSLIYSRQMIGTVPLYRYWRPRATSNDHSHTIIPNEVGITTLRGYISEGIAGYCFDPCMMLLQERFPSITTGREVLEITCTQPILPEWQLVGKWVIIDTTPRVWHAILTEAWFKRIKRKRDDRSVKGREFQRACSLEKRTMKLVTWFLPVYWLVGN